MTTKYKRKSKAIGESFSNAYYRLTRDLLFDFVCKANIKCYRCNGPLTRDTFSIEHKEDWLHHENSREMFLDIENISYSHMKCNSEAASYKQRKGPVVNGQRTKVSDVYDSEVRRKQYLRTEAGNREHINEKRRQHDNKETKDDSRR